MYFGWKRPYLISREEFTAAEVLKSPAALCVLGDSHFGDRWKSKLCHHRYIYPDTCVGFEARRLAWMGGGDNCSIVKKWNCHEYRIDW